MNKDMRQGEPSASQGQALALSAPVIKRSVNIAGHSTSVSLEQPFWDELIAIATTRNIPLSTLIEDIDTARQTNLSSALRLYVLGDLKSRLLGK